MASKGHINTLTGDWAAFFFCRQPTQVASMARYLVINKWKHVWTLYSGEN